MKTIQNVLRIILLVPFYCTPFGWFYIIGAIYMDIVNIITGPPPTFNKDDKVSSDNVSIFSQFSKVFK